MSIYMSAHNTYVEQVHNINGMMEHFYAEEIPRMLQVSILVDVEVKQEADFLLILY